MKASRLLLAVFFFVFLHLSTSADAQLGDMIKKKVEKKAEKEVEKTIDEVLTTIGGKSGHQDSPTKGSPSG